MTTTNDVSGDISGDVKPAKQKKKFFRWSLLVRLLGLVVVFASGFLVAKAMTASKPATQLVVQNYQPPAQQYAAGNQRSTTSSPNTVNRNSLSAPAQTAYAQSKPKQDNKATNSLPAKTYAAQPQTMQRAAVPTNSLPKEYAPQKLSSGGLGSPRLSDLQPTFPAAKFQNTALPQNTAQQNQNALPQNPQSSSWGQSSPSGISAPVPGFAPAFVGEAQSQLNPTMSPEEQEANKAIAELTGKLQLAKKDEKAELSEKLKAQIVELFKLRHTAQAKEIEEMEKQLVDAKALHTKRNEKQDEIVERRLRNLMNEVDDLDWDRNLKSAAVQSEFSGTIGSMVIQNPPANFPGQTTYSAH